MLNNRRIKDIFSAVFFALSPKLCFYLIGNFSIFADKLSISWEELSISWEELLDEPDITNDGMDA